MKALFTLGMVIDLEPDEIPEYAAAIERTGIASLYAGMVEALTARGRELDEEEADLIRERFQMFGVSYSVMHELELPPL